MGTRTREPIPQHRVPVSNELQSTEVAGIDPATGKERRGLEWFDASIMGGILPDGKAIAFLEWGASTVRILGTLCVVEGLE